jgi:gliding motility-associated-like protein
MDKIAPVLSNCPVNITVSTGISCASTVSWSPPTVSDNCNAYTLTSSHTPGSLFSLGITSVTYTATDDFGNSSSCSFQVNVVDNTPPSVTNCPQNITAYANASCRATVNWTAPSATDNCSLQSFTSNYNPGSSFLIGTSIVSYTATDNAGNTSTCSFTVTVIDNSPPVFSSCPSAITVPGSDDCQAVVSWPVPVATDNCSVTITTNHNSGESFPIGTTAVTYTATDGSGNKSVCTFNVTVTDNTSPVFTVCPAAINLSADDACEMPVTWDLPIATDNCDITLTSNHNPGELFPVGVTKVEYKATDNYGNASYCTFTVTIESNERPHITGCPSDINAEADESGSVSVTWTPPVATSTCSEVELTSSHDPGDIFPVGATKVEYVATDASNNETTCTFNVVVAYKEVTLDVVQLVTPNGDGINDEWVIKNLEQFSKNKVTIVDRWGSLIYNASGYNNNDIVWKGINANGQPAPTGTYFYTIEVHFRDRQVKQTGFIELVQ